MDDDLGSRIREYVYGTGSLPGDQEQKIEVLPEPEKDEGCDTQQS